MKSALSGHHVAKLRSMGETSGFAEGVALSGSSARRVWWLTLAGVGAALVVLGTFLPFAHLTLSDGLVFSRTDWQMGANSSVSFGGAPLLLIDLAVLLLGFFAVEGVLGTARTVRERRTSLAIQFWMLVLLAVEFKSTFPGTWTGVHGATVSRGSGGWVTVLGVLVLIGAYAGEVRRYGLARSSEEESLDDRERQVLARAETRPVMRAIAPFVGGTVFALAMKFLFGASWPATLIMFVAMTALYWLQKARRLTNLRRRSETELNQTSSTSR